jgi:hypothetical protein
MAPKSSSFKRENLRTIVEVEPLNRQITYVDRIMLLGSCFTEHIGNRLQALKFNALVNPFGIVYNPLSIADQLDCLLHPHEFTGDDLVFHEGLWHSWSHHSRFSNPDKDSLLKSINEQVSRGSEFMKHTGLMILTFGTSESWYLKSGDRLVSNCHKWPADRFYSRKPNPEELVDRWVPIIKAMVERNPGLRICLTISPVRYLKNGPLGNHLSKSTLFLFIGRMLEMFPELYYFPSYEIFMDDLRDYRFYDSDFAHPGIFGVDYVWGKFVKACLDPEIFALMEEVESAVRAAHHRPPVHVTDAHRRFVNQQVTRLSALASRNPFLDFSEEIKLLQSQAESDQA